MNTLELKSAIEGLAQQTDIDQKIVLDVVKEVVIYEIAEYLNVMDDDILVEVNDEFEFSIFLLKEVVEEVIDAGLEVLLEDGKKIDKDTDIGEFVKVPVNIKEIDRKTIKKLNGALSYRLRCIHNEVLFKEFKEKEGQIVSGTFLRKSGRDFFIDLGRIEARLPFREQSPRERDSYVQGDRIKCYLKEVVLDENNRLSLMLSRIDPNLIKCLFTIEVPELHEGAVKIKSIAREPGRKTKMSVFSQKTGVEPVGACVGLSGIRIKAVINELHGEKIDVIPFTNNVKEYLAKAMQPAKVQKVLIINEEEKEALVAVEDESFPLAIGKDGTNIKLASKLTGWKINLKTQSQIAKHPEIMQIFSKAEDIFTTNVESDLHQLTDIPEEIIVKLMNSGIMTIAELYEKTVNDIAKIDGVTHEDAKRLRDTMDELVEVVDESEIEATREEYLKEVEDEISGVDTDEDIKEEIQRVEYLICPSCNFEFEYVGQEKCPSCGVEFEFDEEDEEQVEEVTE